MCASVSVRVCPSHLPQAPGGPTVPGPFLPPRSHPTSLTSPHAPHVPCDPHPVGRGPARSVSLIQSPGRHMPGRPPGAPGHGQGGPHPTNPSVREKTKDNLGVTEAPSIYEQLSTSSGPSVAPYPVVQGGQCLRLPNPGIPPGPALCPALCPALHPRPRPWCPTGRVQACL